MGIGTLDTPRLGVDRFRALHLCYGWKSAALSARRRRGVRLGNDPSGAAWVPLTIATTRLAPSVGGIISVVDPRSWRGWLRRIGIGMRIRVADDFE